MLVVIQIVAVERLQMQLFHTAQRKHSSGLVQDNSEKEKKKKEACQQSNVNKVTKY